jgi:hypothetical protein
MRLGVREWRNKSLKANICKLCWSADLYHLWRHRNDIRHGKPPRAEEKLLHYVAWDVKNRIRCIGKFRRSDVNVNKNLCELGYYP